MPLNSHYNPALQWHQLLASSQIVPLLSQLSLTCCDAFQITCDNPESAPVLSEEQLAERLSTLEKTQEAFTSGQSKAFYVLSTSSAAALVLLSASMLQPRLLLCCSHPAVYLLCCSHPAVCFYAVLILLPAFSPTSTLLFASMLLAHCCLPFCYCYCYTTVCFYATGTMLSAFLLLLLLLLHYCLLLCYCHTAVYSAAVDSVCVFSS